jgi:hypothetical protein
MFFAGYTNYFLWLEQPNFAATLAGKMKAGTRRPRAARFTRSN